MASPAVVYRRFVVPFSCLFNYLQVGDFFNQPPPKYWSEVDAAPHPFLSLCLFVRICFCLVSSLVSGQPLGISSLTFKRLNLDV